MTITLVVYILAAALLIALVAHKFLSTFKDSYHVKNCRRKQTRIRRWELALQDHDLDRAVGRDREHLPTC